MKNSESDGHSLRRPTLVAATQQGSHFTIQAISTHVERDKEDGPSTIREEDPVQWVMERHQEEVKRAQSLTATEDNVADRMTFDPQTGIKCIWFGPGGRLATTSRPWKSVKEGHKQRHFEGRLRFRDAKHHKFPLAR
jgi:ABC-type ATPase with predicted acetyltransferase domain